MFSLNDLAVTPAAMANYDSVFPPAVARSIARSTLARAPIFLGAYSIAGYISAALALVTLSWLLMARRRPGAPDAFSDPRFTTAALVIAGGVLLNAVVCGCLASPLDRFPS